MTNAEEKVIQTIVELVGANGSVTLPWDHPDISGIIDDLRRAKVKAALVAAPHEIVVRIDPRTREVSLSKIGESATATTTTATKGNAKPKREPKQKAKKVFTNHTFMKPPFHEDMKNMITDAASLICCGTGPTGSGKTSHMRLMAQELDMDLVLVNCQRAMEMSGFTGEKTVEPDEATQQSVIKFVYGPVVRAMRTGLDENGNEVGKPALLVIDEFATIPPWVAIGLNNLLEPGADGRRKMVLLENGGEDVVAHSGMRIVLLGNTIGRGTTMESADYTAQGDALDISTLDRISAIFRYGYYKDAEEQLLLEKIGDDEIVKKTIKFRDAVRSQRKQKGLRTPFSTRLLVQFADAYRVLGDIGKAMDVAVVSKLMPEERAVYSETLFTVFGIDLNAKVTNEMDFDF